MDSAAERRQHPRHEVKRARVYTAEARLGEQGRRCYLQVRDISQSGMCIETQIALKTGDPFPMRFYFEEPLEVQVQVKWQQETESGQLLGLEFVQVPPEAVQRLIERITSSPEQRKSIRVDRCLRFEFEADGVRTVVSSTTLELGRGGMRISSTAALPEALSATALIELEPSQPPISVAIRVAWQKTTSFDTVLVGIEFVNPDRAVLERIDRFVERVRAGTLDAPILLGSSHSMAATEEEHVPS